MRVGIGVASKSGRTCPAWNERKSSRPAPIAARYARMRQGLAGRPTRPKGSRSPVSRMPSQDSGLAVTTGVAVGVTMPHITSPSVALPTATSSSGTPRSSASKMGEASSQRSSSASARPRV